jgi:hypothetical protein
MWAWQLTPAPAGTDLDGGDALPVDVIFDSRSDAETWMGEQWRRLSAAGVREAVLVEDGVAPGEALTLPDLAVEQPHEMSADAD